MWKKMIMLGAALSTVVTVGLGTGFIHAQASLAAPEKELVVDGKKPARFTHATHIAMGMDCGVCHHDKDHKPLTAEGVASVGDVEKLRCVSCHNKESQNTELRKAKDVFHARCKTCHKEGYAGKKGPSKCSDCHLKTKGKAVEGC